MPAMTRGDVSTTMVIQIGLVINAKKPMTTAERIRRVLEFLLRKSTL